MHTRILERLLHVGLITAVASAALAGCMSQDYLRGLGRHATKGAFDAMGEGLPSIEEPLRQTLRRTLVEDDTLRHAARDMSETAVKSLEAGLASPELRRQLDDLSKRVMENLRRDGSEAVRGLIQVAEPEMKEALRQMIAAAEPELRDALRRAAAEGIDILAIRLRERLERDLTPATERLAKRTGEELIASLVVGLEGPLQARLLVAGEQMSKALIKGTALGLSDPTNQDSFGGLTQMMMLKAVRGARQGVQEGLPDERQVALIASIIVLGALLMLCAAALSLFWWRYHQSAKSLTIIAESINAHEAEDLKATIRQTAHENYVGPWLSSFLKHRGL